MDSLLPTTTIDCPAGRAATEAVFAPTPTTRLWLVTVSVSPLLKASAVPRRIVIVSAATVTAGRVVLTVIYSFLNVCSKVGIPLASLRVNETAPGEVPAAVPLVAESAICVGTPPIVIVARSTGSPIACPSPENIVGSRAWVLVVASTQTSTVYVPAVRKALLLTASNNEPPTVTALIDSPAVAIVMAEAVLFLRYPTPARVSPIAIAVVESIVAAVGAVTTTALTNTV